jgi:NMD protein affecting ribosome stability and mRNA decay
MSKHHNVQACERCGHEVDVGDIKDGLCSLCSPEEGPLFEIDTLSKVYVCRACGSEVVLMWGDKLPSSCPTCKRSNL